MSSDTQAIFFFLAFLGCILAGFSNFWGPAEGRSWLGIHPGWLGLAAFTFVFFWTAVKAA